MKIKIEDGCFRRIPTTRDDDRDWRADLVDDVISSPAGSFRRKRRARERTPRFDATTVKQRALRSPAIFPSPLKKR